MTRDDTTALIAAEADAAEAAHKAELEAEARGEALPDYPAENRTRPDRS